MIITKNIRITRIIIGTWKNSVLIVFVCVMSYLFNELFLKHYFNFPAIGQALLNPFDPIPTGISLDQITRTIEINLLETLGESEIPEPVVSVNNEYVM